MKKFIFLIFFFLLLFSLIFSQEVIENPKKPLNPYAGRILEVKEVLRITDEGEEFFFKRPRFLKVAEDGCLFLYDSNQFLKFTSDGRFVKNLLKKGQGPGEIQELLRFVLQDNEIFIYDSGNSKILHMNQEGEFLEEFHLTERYGLLLGLIEDHFVLTKWSTPDTDERTGNFIDIPTSIVVLSINEEVIREFPAAVQRTYQSENYAVSWGQSYTIMSEEDEFCIWTDPEEYMITVLDIGTGDIVCKFTRQYSRVKAPERTTTPPGLKIPERKFLSDIRYIYNFQENILVWTSTFDKENGMLFDLFDKKGTYLDSFWLNVKGMLIGIHKNFLFFIEFNEDGTMGVIKYQVLDGK